MINKMLLPLCAIMMLGTLPVHAQTTSQPNNRLVVIATNDTHSQIDPTDDDNMGGVLRRKVVIDSIRAANPNVLLVDLGDPVQGTMYFNLFGGEVENMVMNELGYDVRILGNHDFDNGMDSLSKNLQSVKSKMLSTNYRFADSVANAMFHPYLIEDFNGRKVGLIGINLQPKGMIAEGNYDGLTHLDAMKAANATSWHLKNNEGVDIVLALTHVGYAPTGTGESDTELAAASQDIDIILGGHSHTVINPADSKSVPWRLPTADPDSVTVTQAGKAGKYVAVVEIDLDSKATDYKLIPIDARYDNHLDSALDAKIQPYRVQVEEIMNKPVGKLSYALDKESDELLNWVADFIRDRGKQLYPAIDFAIVNKGGIRRGLPKGTFTQGQIQSMLPFNNKVVVLELTGKDILDNLGIMARSGGNGLSEEARVEYNPKTGEIYKATLSGKDIDPEKTYYVATIDYLANGGDYMTPLKNGKWMAKSDYKLYDDLLETLTNGKYKGKTINPKTSKRMIPTDR